MLRDEGSFDYDVVAAGPHHPGRFPDVLDDVVVS
jgi:hypothetical protein